MTALSFTIGIIVGMVITGLITRAYNAILDVLKVEDSRRVAAETHKIHAEHMDTVAHFARETSPDLSYYAAMVACSSREIARVIDESIGDTK